MSQEILNIGSNNTLSINHRKQSLTISLNYDPEDTSDKAVQWTVTGKVGDADFISDEFFFTQVSESSIKVSIPYNYDLRYARSFTILATNMSNPSIKTKLTITQAVRPSTSIIDKLTIMNKTGDYITAYKNSNVKLYFSIEPSNAILNLQEFEGLLQYDSQKISNVTIDNDKKFISFNTNDVLGDTAFMILNDSGKILDSVTVSIEDNEDILTNNSITSFNISPVISLVTGSRRSDVNVEINTILPETAKVNPAKLKVLFSEENAVDLSTIFDTENRKVTLNLIANNSLGDDVNKSIKMTVYFGNAVKVVTIKLLGTNHATFLSSIAFKEIDEEYNTNGYKTVSTGDSFDLNLLFTPNDAFFKDIDFEITGNDGNAYFTYTKNTNGIHIDAINPTYNNAVITAYSLSNPSIRADFNLKILYIPRTSISISKDKLDISPDKVFSLTAKPFPSNATAKDYTWSFDKDYLVKTNEASNSDTIFLKAIKQGKTIVSVYCYENGKMLEKRCTVNIINKEDIVITDLAAINPSIVMGVGEVTSLITQLSLSDKTYIFDTESNDGDLRLTYTISDNNICSVNSKGVLVAKKKGSTAATIVEPSGNKETFIVTVQEVGRKENVISSYSLKTSDDSITKAISPAINVDGNFTATVKNKSVFPLYFINNEIEEIISPQAIQLVSSNTTAVNILHGNLISIEEYTADPVIISYTSNVFSTLKGTITLNLVNEIDSNNKLFNTDGSSKGVKELYCLNEVMVNNSLSINIKEAHTKRLNIISYPENIVSSVTVKNNVVSDKSSGIIDIEDITDLILRCYKIDTFLSARPNIKTTLTVDGCEGQINLYVEGMYNDYTIDTNTFAFDLVPSTTGSFNIGDSKYIKVETDPRVVRPYFKIKGDIIDNNPLNCFSKLSSLRYTANNLGGAIVNLKVLNKPDISANFSLQSKATAEENKIPVTSFELVSPNMSKDANTQVYKLTIMSGETEVIDIISSPSDATAKECIVENSYTDFIQVSNNNSERISLTARMVTANPISLIFKNAQNNEVQTHIIVNIVDPVLKGIGFLNNSNPIKVYKNSQYNLNKLIYANPAFPSDFFDTVKVTGSGVYYNNGFYNITSTTITTITISYKTFKISANIVAVDSIQGDSNISGDTDITKPDGSLTEDFNKQTMTLSVLKNPGVKAYYNFSTTDNNNVLMDNKIRYTSSDTSIVDVDPKGKYIIANKVGKTTISCIYNDINGNDVTIPPLITVAVLDNVPNGIIIPLGTGGDSYEMALGENLRINKLITPSFLAAKYNDLVKWTSSNPQEVNIDNLGTATALKITNGVELKCTLETENGTLEDSITVNVTNNLKSLLCSPNSYARIFIGSSNDVKEASISCSPKSILDELVLDIPEEDNMGLSDFINAELIGSGTSSPYIRFSAKKPFANTKQITVRAYQASTNITIKTVISILYGEVIPKEVIAYDYINDRYDNSPVVKTALGIKNNIEPFKFLPEGCYYSFKELARVQGLTDKLNTIAGISSSQVNPIAAGSDTVDYYFDFGSMSHEQELATKVRQGSNQIIWDTNWKYPNCIYNDTKQKPALGINVLNAKLESISIADKSELAFMNIGTKKRITINAYPNTFRNVSIRWEVSAIDGGDVDSISFTNVYLSGSRYTCDLNVTKKGVYKLTAYTGITGSDNNEIKDSVEITVQETVTKLTLSKSSLELVKGVSSELITVSYEPSGITDPKIRFNVANENVAIITKQNANTFLVQPTGGGETSISFSSDIADTYINQCVLDVKTVVKALDIIIPDEYLQNEINVLNFGQIAIVNPTLIAAHEPNSDYDNTVTVSTLKQTSSNQSVLTVLNGSVTAVGAGTAIISFSTTDGSNITKSITFEVPKIYPTKLKLPSNSINILKGSSETIKFEFEPFGVSENVVSIKNQTTLQSVYITRLANNRFSIKGVKNSETETIEFTALDSDKNELIYRLQVRVFDEPRSVVTTESSLTLLKNTQSRYEVSASVLPSDLADEFKGYFLESANTNILQVIEGTKYVVPMAEGRTELFIRSTTKPSVFKSIPVLVYEDVNKIVFTKDEQENGTISMGVNSTIKIPFRYNPETASYISIENVTSTVVCQSTSISNIRFVRNEQYIEITSTKIPTGADVTVIVQFSGTTYAGKTVENKTFKIKVNPVLIESIKLITDTVKVPFDNTFELGNRIYNLVPSNTNQSTIGVKFYALTEDEVNMLPVELRDKYMAHDDPNFDMFTINDSGKIVSSNVVDKQDLFTAVKLYSKENPLIESSYIKVFVRNIPSKLVIINNPSRQLQTGRIDTLQYYFEPKVNTLVDTGIGTIIDKCITNPDVNSYDKYIYKEFGSVEFKSEPVYDDNGEILKYGEIAVTKKYFTGGNVKFYLVDNTAVENITIKYPEYWSPICIYYKDSTSDSKPDSPLVIETVVKKDSLNYLGAPMTRNVLKKIKMNIDSGSVYINWSLEHPSFNSSLLSYIKASIEGGYDKLVSVSLSYTAKDSKTVSVNHPVYGNNKKITYTSNSMQSMILSPIKAGKTLVKLTNLANNTEDIIEVEVTNDFSSLNTTFPTTTIYEKGQEFIVINKVTPLNKISEAQIMYEFKSEYGTELNTSSKRFEVTTIVENNDIVSRIKCKYPINDGSVKVYLCNPDGSVTKFESQEFKFKVFEPVTNISVVKDLPPKIMVGDEGLILAKGVTSNETYPAYDETVTFKALTANISVNATNGNYQAKSDGIAKIEISSTLYPTIKKVISCTIIPVYPTAFSLNDITETPWGKALYLRTNTVEHLLNATISPSNYINKGNFIVTMPMDEPQNSEAHITINRKSGKYVITTIDETIPPAQDSSLQFYGLNYNIIEVYPYEWDPNSEAYPYLQSIDVDMTPIRVPVVLTDGKVYGVALAPECKNIVHYIDSVANIAVTGQVTPITADDTSIKWRAFVDDKEVPLDNEYFTFNTSLSMITNCKKVTGDAKVVLRIYSNDTSIKEFYDDCTIQILGKPQEILIGGDLSNLTKPIVLKAGDSYQLNKATVPENCAFGIVRYGLRDNKGKVSINEKTGTIFALTYGTDYAYAKSTFGTEVITSDLREIQVITPLRKINFKNSELEVILGEETIVELSLVPITAEHSGFYFTVTDTSGVQVNDKFEIKSIDNMVYIKVKTIGQFIVTASSKDDSSITTTLYLNSIVSFNSFKIEEKYNVPINTSNNPDLYTLLKAVVTPDLVMEYATITWSLVSEEHNKFVEIVEHAGMMYLRGKALTSRTIVKIKATMTLGDIVTSQIATVAVVKPVEEIKILDSALEYVQNGITLALDGTYPSSIDISSLVKVLPEDATVKSLNLEIPEAIKNKVSVTGTIIEMKDSHTDVVEIKVYAHNGIFVKFKLRLKPFEINKILISDYYLSPLAIKKGTSLQLSYEVLPANLPNINDYNFRFTMKGVNSGISITPTGLLTVGTQASGEAYIYVYDANGLYTNTFPEENMLHITVVEELNSFTIGTIPDSIGNDVLLGNTYKLPKPSITPESAKNTSYEYDFGAYSKYIESLTFDANTNTYTMKLVDTVDDYNIFGTDALGYGTGFTMRATVNSLFDKNFSTTLTMRLFPKVSEIIVVDDLTTAQKDADGNYKLYKGAIYDMYVRINPLGAKIGARGLSVIGDETHNKTGMQFTVNDTDSPYLKRISFNLVSNKNSIAKNTVPAVLRFTDEYSTISSNYGIKYLIQNEELNSVSIVGDNSLSVVKGNTIDIKDKITFKTDPSGFGLNNLKAELVNSSDSQYVTLNGLSVTGKAITPATDVVPIKLYITGFEDVFSNCIVYLKVTDVSLISIKLNAFLNLDGTAVSNFDSKGGSYDCNVTYNPSGDLLTTDTKKYEIISAVMEPSVDITGVDNAHVSFVNDSLGINPARLVLKKNTSPYDITITVTIRSTSNPLLTSEKKLTQLSGAKIPSGINIVPENIKFLSTGDFSKSNTTENVITLTIPASDGTVNEGFILSIDQEGQDAMAALGYNSTTPIIDWAKAVKDTNNPNKYHITVDPLPDNIKDKKRTGLVTVITKFGSRYGAVKTFTITQFPEIKVIMTNKFSDKDYVPQLGTERDFNVTIEPTEALTDLANAFTMESVPLDVLRVTTNNPSVRRIIANETGTMIEQMKIIARSKDDPTKFDESIVKQHGLSELKDISAYKVIGNTTEVLPNAIDNASIEAKFVLNTVPINYAGPIKWTVKYTDSVETFPLTSTKGGVLVTIPENTLEEPRTIICTATAEDFLGDTAIPEVKTYVTKTISQNRAPLKAKSIDLYSGESLDAKVYNNIQQLTIDSDYKVLPENAASRIIDVTITCTNPANVGNLRTSKTTNNVTTDGLTTKFSYDSSISNKWLLKENKTDVREVYTVKLVSADGNVTKTITVKQDIPLYSINSGEISFSTVQNAVLGTHVSGNTTLETEDEVAVNFDLELFYPIAGVATSAQIMKGVNSLRTVIVRSTGEKVVFTVTRPTNGFIKNPISIMIPKTEETYERMLIKLEDITNGKDSVNSNELILFRKGSSSLFQIIKTGTVPTSKPSAPLVTVQAKVYNTLGISAGSAYKYANIDSLTMNNFVFILGKLSKGVLTGPALSVPTFDQELRACTSEFTINKSASSTGYDSISFKVAYNETVAGYVGTGECALVLPKDVYALYNNDLSELIAKQSDDILKNMISNNAVTIKFSTK